jgi:hypothetical protein
MGIFIKIVSWLKMNGAAVIGCIQALIKAVKEVLTAALDLISIFIPVAVAQGIIDKVRAVLTAIDGALEKVKPFLLKLN